MTDHYANLTIMLNIKIRHIPTILKNTEKQPNITSKFLLYTYILYEYLQKQQGRHLNGHAKMIFLTLNQRQLILNLRVSVTGILHLTYENSDKLTQTENKGKQFIMPDWVNSFPFPFWGSKEECVHAYACVHKHTHIDTHYMSSELLSNAAMKMTGFGKKKKTCQMMV